MFRIYSTFHYLHIVNRNRYMKEKSKKQTTSGMLTAMSQVLTIKDEILNFSHKNVPALKNKDVQQIAYSILLCLLLCSNR